MAFFKKKNKNERPPFEAAYIYLLLTLTAYMIADNVQLYLRSLPAMLPSKAPPSKPQKAPGVPLKSYSEYAPIAARNIFNSDGLIPKALQMDGQKEENAVPVLSQLPLELVGTMVHLDPAKSIASINLKQKNEIQPFVVGEDIQGMAKITKVERLKVIFRNSNNGRMEFIEIAQTDAISFDSRAPVVSNETAQRQGNTFTLKRSTLEKHLEHMDDLLTSARAVPWIPPGSNRIEGFTIMSIAPNSVFRDLGIEPNDIIKAANGEPVNSAARAMELVNSLRSADSITLTVNRNGRDETLSYTIR